MPTKTSNGTKPEENQDLDNLPVVDLDNVTLTNIDKYPLDTPKPSLKTSIKIEGLPVLKTFDNQFSEETVNSLIALSESLGIEPETAISKILDAVFGDNSHLISLYKQIASKHREKLLKQDIEKIEHLRAQKQRELSAIELELQHRTKFPNC